MRRMIQVLCSVLLLCAVTVVNAAEVDSFTNRHELEDSRPLLNRLVNTWMDEAAEKASEPGILPIDAGRCDPERLYGELEKRLAGFLIGHVEDWVNTSPLVEKIAVDFEHSIYRDFPFSESPSVAMTGRLATLVRIGDAYVGSDKFGHFFSEGYSYFKLYRRSGADASLAFGELTEATVFGQLTTGIYSYADLSANLNGLRFWNRVLGALPDPVTRQPVTRPYFACEGTRWVQVQPFDWNDYVDATWDEAANCNVVKSEVLYDQLIRRIRTVTHGKACPLYRPDSTLLAARYGDFLPYVWNPDGIRVEAVDIRPRFQSYLAHLWESQGATDNRVVR
ncbi:hypothetical protein AAIA72_12465 [Hahella sp. SMD15-11]|uniref:Uncharacterized protein n=1 Tax=Thermohahella caldifontis TaxID=3142973 RepID=A0AB39UTL2_9GAMM